ncbi:MAG: hypothetical protein QOI56_524 [Actinomycetota bacterium]|nr:hypothetical protein [Actinomycetota bacterium]
MRRLGAVAVVGAGSVALLARPWLVRLPVDPVTILVVLFVVLGVVGATWRLPAVGPAGGSAVGDDAWRLPAVGPAHGSGGLEGESDGGPEGGRRARGPVPGWLALGVGLGAFAGGRLVALGSLPAAPLVVRSLALNSLAAVAEEAFFRRLAYGVAEIGGPVLAVVASAVVFAAVHVTVWGWAVLPLDLAAGLVLGWQRWASGGWSVPAATHVAANVLAVL